MDTLRNSLLTFGIAAAFAATAGAQTPGYTTPGGAAPPAGPQVQQGFTGELRSGPWGDDTFARLDTNRDGILSREEAQADPIVKGAWDKLDLRNAGRVSKEEFAKYGASQVPSNTAPNFGTTGTDTSAPKK